MKKTLLVLTVLGAYATAAQAVDFTVDGTNLSVYGVLDGAAYTMSSPHAPAGLSSTTWGIASNNMQTSRLGFGANTDLGSGLKITGNLEEEISISTGGQGDGATVATPTAAASGGGTYNRAANVGLASPSWGEIKLGRQITPSLMTAVQLDAMGSQSGGYTNAWAYSQLVNSIIFTGAGALNGGAATDQNFNGGNNAPDLFVAALSYTSPIFSGFQVRLLQTFGSNNSPGSGNTGQPFGDSGVTDFSLRYDDGSFAFSLADNAVNIGNSVAGAYSGRLENNLQVGGSYKFGDTKVTLAYGDIAYADGYKAALKALANSSPPDDVEIWSLGATQQVGQYKFGLSYTDIKDKDHSANGVSDWSALVDFAFNKQGDVYAQLTSSDNKGNAQYSGLYGSALPSMAGGVGGTVNSLAVGLRYKF